MGFSRFSHLIAAWIHIKNDGVLETPRSSPYHLWTSLWAHIKLAHLPSWFSIVVFSDHTILLMNSRIGHLICNCISNPADMPVSILKLTWTLFISNIQYECFCIHDYLCPWEESIWFCLIKWHVFLAWLNDYGLPFAVGLCKKEENICSGWLWFCLWLWVDGLWEPGVSRQGLIW